MTAATEVLAEIGAPVEAFLADRLARERARWAAIDARSAEPLAVLAGFVDRGGKRLRPGFAYWAFRGAGGSPDDPRIVRLGAALELLQAFALVHDDVMDDSDTRRGETTVHRAAAADHRHRAGLGDPDLYGTGVAILIGNLAHAYADELIAECSPAIVPVWQELRVEINIGQYLDLRASADPRRDAATSRLIAQYKSGRYTIERPLELGAVLAGRGDLVDGFRAFGGPLGEAFQLRDDLLGVFGDPAVTGKPVGADLVEAKPTLLLALAHDLAGDEQSRILARVGTPLDPGDVAEVMETIRATGAAELVDQRITELTDAALAALDALAIDPAATDALETLARFLATRTT